MKKGRPEKLTPELREVVRKILYNNPKTKIEDIQIKLREYLIKGLPAQEEYRDMSKEAIVKMLDEPEGPLPGISAITKYGTPVRKKIIELRKNPKEVDTEWTIGACAKYNIPAELVPFLLQIQSLFGRNTLTIRQARWCCILYPGVRAQIKGRHRDIVVALTSLLLFLHFTNVIPNLNQEQIDEIINLRRSSESEQNKSGLELSWLWILSIQYAKAEQINDLPDDEQPKLLNTSELDNLFFVKQDISVEALIDGLWSAFTTPKQKKQSVDFAVNFKGFSSQELEAKFGQLTQNQVDIINAFVGAQFSGFLPVREWIEQHPNEWSELDKVIKAMEEKENERSDS